MPRTLTKTGFVVLVLALAIAFWPRSVQGASSHLTNRFDELSTSVAGATATNLFGFGITDDVTPLGSIEFQFCANDPIPGDSCTAPTGMDASGAVLSAQTGSTGFSVYAPGTNANTVVLTRSPAAPTPPVGFPNTYQLDDIINPTTVDTLYVRVYVFQTDDASGPDTEDGGIAIAINNSLSVSAEVPPFLLFCTAVSITGHDCTTATSYYINFGNLSPAHTSTATSQFVTATNAQNGYNVSVAGTTMTSGNNTINAPTSPALSTSGTSQFGLNLRANSDPPVGADPSGNGNGAVSANYDNVNQFAFNNNDTLVSTVSPSDYQTFTTSYLVNVSSGQPVGVYSTTLSYICLANF
jgi:hypothetical protein